MRTLSAAVLVALATASQAAAAPAARSAHGSDLGGVWTNVSITPFERDPRFGTRLVHTPEEARALEGAAVKRFEEGNKPTDPSVGALDQTSKACRSADGLDCGYNSGWKDSGTSLMRVGGQPRTSFLTTPDGRAPPRRAGAAPPAQRTRVMALEQADNPEDRALGERCLTSFGYSAGPVMLPLMYNNNYQFVQTKDDVAIYVEMVHDVRHIRVGAKTHLPSHVRPWFGDSIGWWEGTTLVSETTNFHPQQSFRGSDANLKVMERFTRLAPDRLLYKFEVSDPTVWDKPWGGEYEFTPSGGQVFEYACHEGNYALQNMLAGARAKERAQERTRASGAAPTKVATAGASPAN